MHVETKKSCLVSGCLRKVIAKSMCSMHWKRAVDGRDLYAPAPEDRPTCEVEGCTVRPPAGHGPKCHRHSRDWRRENKKIPDTRVPCGFHNCMNAKWPKGDNYCYWHTLQERRGGELTPVGVQGRSPDRCTHSKCRNQTYREELCLRHYEAREEGSADLYDGPVGMIPCPIIGCRHLRRSSKSLCQYHNTFARKFGLTPHTYRDMINGGCEICGSTFRMCIDHDHSCCPQAGKSCGKCVRGALCGNCNNMLGHAKGHLNLLKGADYLSRFDSEVF